MTRIIALLVDISKNCRSELFLISSIGILVVHAQLLKEVVVFLLDHCW